MARQNIDEKWKEDPRKKALAKRIGDRAANGMRVEINWLVLDHKGKPIPLKEFNYIENAQDWIECGLAEVRGDMVHIAGADRYDEFFDKQKENGSKGGRPKTQRNPKKPKKTQPNPTITETNPKNPSFSFSSSPSSSLSSSDSGSGSSSGSLEEEDENPSDSKPQAFIAGYCERFKKRWDSNPEIQGKDAGIVARVIKGWSQSKADLYLDAFFLMPDAYVIKAKHPLTLFESKLNEVVVFANSGQFTTAREAINADNSATNALLMQKVKRGEIK